MSALPRPLAKKALDRWGLKLQLLKTIEECGELQRAISRELNEYQDPEILANLVEEIIDVHLMVEQLTRYYKAEYPTLYTLVYRQKIDHLKELLGL